MSDDVGDPEEGIERRGFVLALMVDDALEHTEAGLVVDLGYKLGVIDEEV
ncbi:MAG TPA: hypothetical protein VI729_05025 [Anaerolineales bacterium]|nr:hypothetical protein [Anaerolineales bacterium]